MTAKSDSENTGNPHVATTKFANNIGEPFSVAPNTDNPLLEEILSILRHPTKGEWSRETIAEKERVKKAHQIEALINKRVLEATAELANLYGSPRCENLHHSKKNQHSALEDCPVVRQIASITNKEEAE